MHMLRRITDDSPYSVRTNFNLRLAALCIAVMGLLGLFALRASRQTVAPTTAPVSRTTKAINYGRKGTTLKILFHGTDLMQQAAGEAKVENKCNRIEIYAKVEGFEEATKFGLEYLTYVLWAVYPRGHAVNHSEVQITNRQAKLKLTLPPTAIT